MMLDHALAYASRGWHVFPLVPKDKKPVIPRCHPPGHGCRRECGRDGHGLWDATTDEKCLRRWWARWPQANIGLACGLSGLAVIDVDPHHGGLESLDQVDYPTTLMARTGSGGYHIYCVGVVRCRNGLLPGIDLKSEGGYVVLPPSIHPNGQPYRWELEVPIAPLPESIRAMLAPRTVGQKPAPVIKPSSRYAEAALRNELSALSQTMGAGQRHTPLFHAAIKLGTLVGAGLLNESDTHSALVAQAVAKGMAEREAVRVARDGLQIGKQHPRQSQEPSRLNGRIEHKQPLIIGQQRDDLPSLVFTGMWLPEWTERIRRSRPELVIVALAGRDGLELANHLNANGVVAHLACR